MEFYSVTAHKHFNKSVLKTIRLPIKYYLCASFTKKEICMIVYPNAKINLGLNIVSRRPDGYHNIETVFYPISLCDTLKVVRANVPDYTFVQKGLVVDAAPQDNLIIKTYKLLQQHYSISGIGIEFEKNIPYGAGLGGGSADAAFMLKALNELFGLNMSVSEQEKLIGQLGADCPFFIRNKAVYAEGIGNEFTPIQLNLNGYFLVLIKPDIHVSTPDAYKNVKPQPAMVSLCEIVENKPVSEWNNLIRNDFEQSVFPKYPRLAQIKQQLCDCGAVYASMSGSGSSLFGLFAEQTEIPDFENCFVFKTTL